MTILGADLTRVSSRDFLLYLDVHVLSWHESLYHRVTLDRKKPLLAARRGVDGGCCNREYLPAGSVSFAYRILASPSCQIRCRGARIMSHADIEKWISGEIEVFDPHQIALPSGDSNPQKESSSMRPFFRRFTQPAIAIVVVCLGIGTAVGFVISTRYSVEPLAAAAMSAQSADETAIDDPPPNLHQRTTTLSDTGLTTSLKDWMALSLSPTVASASLPPRHPVTPPAPPEPPSEAKQQYPPRTAAEALARAPRVDKFGGALSAIGPSGPGMAKLPSHPLWSDSVARLPISEASPMPERAKAFANSYWQRVDDSGDRVLPYLSSI